MELSTHDKAEIFEKLQKYLWICISHPGYSDNLNNKDIMGMFISLMLGGNIAAYVWYWIHEQERLDLVPWVKDPEHIKYDLKKVAEHEGFCKCLSALKDMISCRSRELKKLCGLDEEVEGNQYENG